MNFRRYGLLGGMYVDWVLWRVSYELQGKLILDFGCGGDDLRSISNNNGVVGYDVDPTVSDLLDYRHLKPDTIVASHVLEHLSAVEIEETLNDFKRMNPQHLLIVALPTETKISLLIYKITKYLGLCADNHNHYLSLREVNRILERRYNIIRRYTVFLGWTEITAYKLEE